MLRLKETVKERRKTFPNRRREKGRKEESKKKEWLIIGNKGRTMKIKEGKGKYVRQEIKVTNERRKKKVGKGEKRKGE